MICKIDLSNLMLPFIVLLVLSCNQSSEPIVIATFDHSLENWIKEGKAFGEGPVKETMGYYGEAHLSSLNELNEPSTGRLTSLEFRIERNYIHFLLGAREIDFMNEKGNLVLVYNTKKYGIPCERRFEINPNSVVIGFVSNGCF